MQKKNSFNGPTFQRHSQGLKCLVSTNNGKNKMMQNLFQQSMIILRF